MTFTLQLTEIEHWKLKMFTKLENIKYKITKCTLSVQIPYFCAISHIGTITLQYLAYEKMIMMMMMMVVGWWWWNICISSPSGSGWSELWNTSGTSNLCKNILSSTDIILKASFHKFNKYTKGTGWLSRLHDQYIQLILSTASMLT